MIPWSITDKEMELTEKCISTAMSHGASAVRVTMSKSLIDLVKTLNGELDKVTHSGDRELIFNIFSEGKYGVYSTNKIEESTLNDFIAKSVKTVQLLTPDKFRTLPNPQRVAKNATSGLELGLYDDTYSQITPNKRLDIVEQASIFGKTDKILPKGCRLISEEIEYSDSISDCYIVDSQGLRCRHIESSFELGCGMTIEDSEQNKLSSYWWDASPFLNKTNFEGISAIALKRALSKIGAKEISGGKFNMVVENEIAARLVSPILSALSASSLQQNNSFLMDSLGKKIFPKGLNLIDKPFEKGKSGSRLFDSEGVATKESFIIETGEIKEYFVNTYMAGKMGIAPTIESYTRACLLPYLKDSQVPDLLDKDTIMKKCDNGILITGFNGGNSNSATGDFSYGIEGFAFNNGKLTHPVRNMVITGNFISLWNNLIAVGNDYRTCKNNQIPTLAFSNVDFSA